MYSIVVLGLVPGTNIQISFQAWLVMTAIIVGALIYKLEHYNPSALRLPLPASRLHQRVQ